MNEDRRHSAEKNPHATRMGTSDAAPREAARLYLVTPPVIEPGAIADDLADALNAADIAAVLLRLGPGDAATQTARVEALRILIQSNGAALLLDGHPDLVASTQADGAHLTGIEALRKAAPALKPKYIAGCGGLASRHDAIDAGEAGADYVMFGEPEADGRRPGFDAIAERVAWWAEVTTVPCVAYADNLDEVAALAQAGADFVAAAAAVWRGPNGAKSAVSAIVERLGAMEPAR
jgi:thiamine-phosphate pyrophosphorylase